MDRANTWIEMNLDELEENMSSVKAWLNGKKLLFVVKANGYGSGALSVSKVAEESGKVDYLGVTHVEEALELREGGISLPILVMGEAVPEQSKWIVEHDLTQTVATKEMAEALSKTAKEKNKTVKVHIKVDTGLRRYGISYEEAYQFVKEVMALENLCVEGIFTHFASAVGDEAFSRLQIKRFLSVLKQLEEANIEIPLKHVCNSEGALLYPEAHLDMVRMGNLLYGMNPYKKELPMKIVNPWKVRTKVVVLKRVEKGQTVGYGRRYKAKKDMVIGVIPVGTADGFMAKPVDTVPNFSTLTKGVGSLFAKFLGKRVDTLKVNGQAFEIIDNMSIQQTIFDATPYKDKIQIGDICEIGIRRPCANAKILRVYSRHGKEYFHYYE